MKNLLLLVTLLTHSLAFAGSYKDYFSYCVLKKNGNFPYEIEQIPEFNRELYTPTNSFDDATFHAVSGVIRGSTRIYDEARNLLSVLGRGEYIEGKKIRDWTMSSLKEQVRTHRLNGFEKAMLVNCATFMLIDYRNNMSTKLGSLLKIYETGQGICTEMTAVAKDLGASIGLKVRSMASKKDHNWPEYYIEGRWYILDPTANGQTLYESLKQ